VYTFKNAEGKEVFIGIDTANGNRVALLGTITGGVASIQMALDIKNDLAWSGNTGGYVMTKLSTEEFLGVLSGQGLSAGVTEVKDPTKLATFTTKNDVKSSADRVFTFLNAKGEKAFIGIDSTEKNRIVLSGVVEGGKNIIQMALNIKNDLAWSGNTGGYVMTKLSTGELLGLLNGKGQTVGLVKDMNGDRVLFNVKTGEVLVSAVKTGADSFKLVLNTKFASQEQLGIVMLFSQSLTASGFGKLSQIGFSAGKAFELTSTTNKQGDTTWQLNPVGKATAGDAELGQLAWSLFANYHGLDIKGVQFIGRDGKLQMITAIVTNSKGAALAATSSADKNVIATMASYTNWSNPVGLRDVIIAKTGDLKGQTVQVLEYSKGTWVRTSVMDLFKTEISVTAPTVTTTPIAMQASHTAFGTAARDERSAMRISYTAPSAAPAAETTTTVKQSKYLGYTVEALGAKGSFRYATDFTTAASASASRNLAGSFRNENPALFAKAASFDATITFNALSFTSPDNKASGTGTVSWRLASGETVSFDVARSVTALGAIAHALTIGDSFYVAKMDFINKYGATGEHLDVLVLGILRNTSTDKGLTQVAADTSLEASWLSLSEIRNEMVSFSVQKEVTLAGGIKANLTNSYGFDATNNRAIGDTVLSFTQDGKNVQYKLDRGYVKTESLAAGTITITDKFSLDSDKKPTVIQMEQTYGKATEREQLLGVEGPDASFMRDLASKGLAISPELLGDIKQSGMILDQTTFTDKGRVVSNTSYLQWREYNAATTLGGSADFVTRIHYFDVGGKEQRALDLTYKSAGAYSDFTAMSGQQLSQFLAANPDIATSTYNGSHNLTIEIASGAGKGMQIIQTVAGTVTVGGSASDMIKQQHFDAFRIDGAGKLYAQKLRSDPNVPTETLLLTDRQTITFNVKTGVQMQTHTGDLSYGVWESLSTGQATVVVAGSVVIVVAAVAATVLTFGGSMAAGGFFGLGAAGTAGATVTTAAGATATVAWSSFITTTALYSAAGFGIASLGSLAVYNGMNAMTSSFLVGAQAALTVASITGMVGIGRMLTSSWTAATTAWAESSGLALLGQLSSPLTRASLGFFLAEMTTVPLQISLNQMGFTATATVVGGIGKVFGGLSLATGVLAAGFGAARSWAAESMLTRVGTKALTAFTETTANRFVAAIPKPILNPMTQAASFVVASGKQTASLASRVFAGAVNIAANMISSAVGAQVFFRGFNYLTPRLQYYVDSAMNTVWYGWGYHNTAGKAGEEYYLADANAGLWEGTAHFWEKTMEYAAMGVMLHAIGGQLWQGFRSNLTGTMWKGLAKGTDTSVTRYFTHVTSSGTLVEGFIPAAARGMQGFAGRAMFSKPGIVLQWLATRVVGFADNIALFTVAGQIPTILREILPNQGGGAAGGEAPPLWMMVVSLYSLPSTFAEGAIQGDFTKFIADYESAWILLMPSAKGDISIVEARRGLERAAVERVSVAEGKIDFRTALGSESLVAMLTANSALRTTYGDSLVKAAEGILREFAIADVRNQLAEGASKGLSRDVSLETIIQGPVTEQAKFVLEIARDNQKAGNYKFAAEVIDALFTANGKAIESTSFGGELKTLREQLTSQGATSKNTQAIAEALYGIVTERVAKGDSLNLRVAIELLGQLKITTGMKEFKIGEGDAAKTIVIDTEVQTLREQYIKSLPDFKKEPVYIRMKAEVAANEYVRQRGSAALVEGLNSGKFEKLGDIFEKAAVNALVRSGTLTEAMVLQAVLDQSLVVGGLKVTDAQMMRLIEVFSRDAYGQTTTFLSEFRDIVADGNKDLRTELLSILKTNAEFAPLVALRKLDPGLRTMVEKGQRSRETYTEAAVRIFGDMLTSQLKAEKEGGSYFAELKLSEKAQSDIFNVLSSAWSGEIARFRKAEVSLVIDPATGKVSVTIETGRMDGVKADKPTAREEAVARVLTETFQKPATEIMQRLIEKTGGKLSGEALSVLAVGLLEVYFQKKTLVEEIVNWDGLISPVVADPGLIEGFAAEYARDRASREISDADFENFRTQLQSGNRESFLNRLQTEFKNKTADRFLREFVAREYGFKEYARVFFENTTVRADGNKGLRDGLYGNLGGFRTLGETLMLIRCADIMYRGTGSEKMLNQAQFEGLRILFSQQELLNLSVGGGKTFLMILLDGAQNATVHCVESVRGVQGVTENAEYKALAGLLGIRFENGERLFEQIKMRGEVDINAKDPSLIAAENLIKYLEGYKDPVTGERVVVVITMQTLGHLQNDFRMRGDMELYGRFLKAYQNSVRNFDEIHRAVDPTYFIIGGKPEAASEALTNFGVLFEVNKHLQQKDVVLFYEKGQFLDKDGKVYTANNGKPTADSLIFVRNSSDWKDMKNQGAVVWFDVTTGEVRAWTEGAATFFEKGKAAEAIKDASQGLAKPLYGSELASILKVHALRNDEIPLIDILLNGKVRKLPESGQYRPVSAEGMLLADQIISDTAWLMAIAFKQNDTGFFRAEIVDAKTAERKAEVVEKTEVIGADKNGAEKTGFTEEAMRARLSAIEVTRTETAASMFDLFKVQEGAERATGMSGTAAPVSIMLEILTGRGLSTAADPSRGDTGAFLFELLSKPTGEQKRADPARFKDSPLTFDIMEMQAEKFLDNVGGFDIGKFTEYVAEQIATRYKNGERSVLAGFASDSILKKVQEVLESKGVKDVIVIDSTVTDVEARKNEFNARGQESVVLAVQHALIGVDYQRDMDYLSFCSNVTETQLIQNAGRINRGANGRISDVAGFKAGLQKIEISDRAARQDFIKQQAGKDSVLAQRLLRIDQSLAERRITPAKAEKFQDIAIKSFNDAARSEGGRFEGGVVVFLDGSYLAAQFDVFKDSKAVEAWKGYFGEKIQNERAAQALLFKFNGEQDAAIRQTRGLEGTKSILDVLSKLEASKGDISVLNESERMLLSYAMNSAHANDATARSMVGQVMDFELMHNPVREAFTLAQSEGAKPQDSVLIEGLGRELHRHSGSFVDLMEAAQYNKGDSVVRGTIESKARSTREMFEKFLGDHRSELSKPVVEVLERAVTLAREVEAQNSKDYAKISDATKQKNGPYADIFHGNAVQYKADGSLDAVPTATNLISIASRFAIEILPSATGGRGERGALQMAAASGRVELPATMRRDYPQLQSVTEGKYRVERQGNTLTVDVGGKTIDLSNLSASVAGLIGMGRYFTLNVQASGQMTIEADLDRELKGSTERQRSVENLQGLLGKGIVSEGWVGLVQAYQGLTQAGISEEDRSRIVQLCISGRWNEVVTVLGNTEGLKSDLRIQALSGLALGVSAQAIEQFVMMDVSGVSALGALGYQDSVEASIASTLGVDRAVVRGISPVALYNATKHSITVTPENRKDVLSRAVALAILASPEIRVARGVEEPRRTWAASTLKIAPQNIDFSGFEGMGGEIENLTAVIINRALLLNKPFQDVTDYATAKLQEVFEVLTAQDEYRFGPQGAKYEQPKPLDVTSYEIVKAMVFGDRTKEEALAGIELMHVWDSEATGFKIDSLQDAIRLASFGFDAASKEFLAAYLGQLAAVKISVTDSKELVQIMDRVFSDEDLQAYSAMVKEALGDKTFIDQAGSLAQLLLADAVKSLLTRSVEDPAAVLVQGLDYRPLLDIKGVSAVPALEFKFGKWQVSATHANGEKTEISLGSESTTVQVRNVSGIVTTRASVRGKEVVVETAQDERGRFLKFSRNDLKTPLAVTVKSAAGEMLVTLDSMSSVLEGGFFQAEYQVNGSLVRSLTRNLRNVENLDAGAVLRSYEGGEVVREKALPVFSRLSVENGSSVLKVYADREMQKVIASIPLAATIDWTVKAAQDALTIAQLPTGQLQELMLDLYGDAAFDGQAGERDALISWLRGRLEVAKGGRSMVNELEFLRNLAITFKGSAVIESAVKHSQDRYAERLQTAVKVDYQRTQQGLSRILEAFRFASMPLAPDSAEFGKLMDALVTIFQEQTGKTVPEDVLYASPKILIDDLLELMPKDIQNEFLIAQAKNTSSARSFKNIVAWFEENAGTVKENKQKFEKQFDVLKTYATLHTGVLALLMDPRALSDPRLQTIVEGVDITQLAGRLDDVDIFAVSRQDAGARKLGEFFKKNEKGQLVKPISEVAEKFVQFLESPESAEHKLQFASKEQRAECVKLVETLLGRGDIKVDVQSFAEFQAIRAAAGGNLNEWLQAHGYSDRTIPFVQFSRYAVNELGKYWKFFANNWGERSGAENIIGDDMNPTLKKGGKDTGESNVMVLSGLILLDEKYAEQSVPHEALHLIFPRPYLWLRPQQAVGNTEVIMLEEVNNYVAQIVMEVFDREAMRQYDIQVIYGKFESYAASHNFDPELLKAAFNSIIRLMQVVNDEKLVLNILKYTHGVSDLLWWQDMDPAQLQAQMQTMKTLLGTQPPQRTELKAGDVLPAAAKAVADGAVKLSTPTVVETSDLDATREADLRAATDVVKGILGDPREMGWLVATLGRLRGAVPFEQIAQSGMTPLEYAAAHPEIIVQFSDAVTIIPASESFKRHILRVTVGEGKTIDLEIKIPGDTRTKVSDNDFYFAQQGTSKFGSDSRFVRPLLMAETSGTADMYGLKEPATFTANQPLRVIVFEYQDAKRIHFSPGATVALGQGQVMIDDAFMDGILERQGKTVTPENRQAMRESIFRDVLFAGSMILDSDIIPYHFEIDPKTGKRVQQLDTALGNFSITRDGRVLIASDFENSEFVTGEEAAKRSLGIDRIQAGDAVRALDRQDLQTFLAHDLAKAFGLEMDVRKVDGVDVLFVKVNGQWTDVGDRIFSTNPTGARAELRKAESADGQSFKNAVHGIGAITPKALQAFLLDRALANLRARGIEFQVRPEFVLPGDEQMKPGKLGYYDETTEKTVLDDSAIQMLAAQLNGANAAMMDPVQLELLELRLAQMEKELQVLLAHEHAHALGEGESEAYAAALEEAKLVGLEEWKQRVLAALRDRNALLEKSKARDEVQIILGGGISADRLTAEEIISNALNAKLYQYGDSDLKRSDVEDLGGTPARLEALVEKILASPKSMTFEHHLFLIRQDQLSAEVEPLLTKLVERGFVIGVYTDQDKLQPNGVEQIFGLAQLAAWLGKTQFLEFFKGEVPDGFDGNGRIRLAAYLSNALVQVLLSEILSAQQVASAA